MDVIYTSSECTKNLLKSIEIACKKNEIRYNITRDKKGACMSWKEYTRYKMIKRFRKAPSMYWVSM